MKFYEECLECNAMSQNNIITSFQMYEVYKNWYIRLYHSPPPENITDLIIQLNNFTPLIESYDNQQFQKDKNNSTNKIQRWIGVKIKK
jgi:hypothetical protein